jgi:hypothetical protein
MPSNAFTNFDRLPTLPFIIKNSLQEYLALSQSHMKAIPLLLKEYHLDEGSKIH